MLRESVWSIMRCLVVAFLFLMAGCQSLTLGEFNAFSDSPEVALDTSNVGYYPNDQLLVSGKAQFREGNFGKSYALFKKAIDVAPADPAAWLGFAASADMLRQFDRADYAYNRLKPVIGNRVEFLNNYGYSMLLRGELVAARKHFLKAYEQDPSNPVTANNLELLRNSVQFPRRARDDLKGI